MKREDIKKEFMKDNRFKGEYILPEGVESRGLDIINKIFNNIESQVCSNCKWSSLNKEKCNSSGSPLVWLDIETFDKFGCNQWE